MRQNYNEEMRERLESFRKENEREPRILLHTCCTPCLSGCIDRLENADTTLFFYNPNIDSDDEHQYRLDELYRYLGASGKDLPVIEVPYAHDTFLKAARGLEDEPERGKRCKACFRMRLKKTAERSRDGYDFFATTLTLSPLKSAPMINKIGEEVAAECGATYLVSDFKKKDGYKKSIEESKKYDLYRQNFCGCEFSKE